MVVANNAIYNTVGASVSGVTNQLTITNPSNTASSAARASITVGGATSSDPSLNFNVTGATDWEIGIDNSASDFLKISNSTSLGTNDYWIMTTAGERTMPLQPAFQVYLASQVNNVTGNGTLYTIAYDTEVFDQGSDYNLGTSTFTAPVTGRYQFQSAIRALGLVNLGANNFRLRLETSNRVYNLFAAAANSTYANTMFESGSILADMDSGDTAIITFFSDGGSKTASVAGDSFGAQNTYFSGFLCV